MLKRVKIQGYKSLVDVEVYLQPLSILFGPNAVGKSNFLDALQLLSRIATSSTLKDAFNPPYRGAPLESFTFGINGMKDVLAKEKATFSIEVDIEISPSTIDKVNHQIQELDDREKKASVREKYLRYHIEIAIVPKTGMLYVTDEHVIALDAQGQPIRDKAHTFLVWDGNQRFMEGQKTARFSTLRDRSFLLPYVPVFHPHLVAIREELASWFFYYLEPRERMRLSTPVKEVRHIGLMGEELAAFLNTLRAVDEVQFKAVENALHMMVPSITGIDVNVNDFGEVELFLLEGQTPISSRLVSEGTLRVLGLLALSGAKDQPSLIGFEEPENGIHPRRLRLISSLLETRARHGSQIIVTTHSSLLPDLVPRESLYVCRKHRGQTTIEPFSLWEIPDVDAALDDVDVDEELSISERVLRGDFDA